MELSSYAKDGLVKSRRLFPCNELEDVGCDVSDIPPEMEPRLSQDVQDDIYMDRYFLATMINGIISYISLSTLLTLRIHGLFV